MRGATLRCIGTCPGDLSISIHAPRAGRDHFKKNHSLSTTGFQSTRPVRGATGEWVSGKTINQFQSTRPVRGATCSFINHHTMDSISIHAPRAGRDSIICHANTPLQISIHAPRAGRDWPAVMSHYPFGISIHAPRAGRDVAFVGLGVGLIISIHAPRAGRDKLSNARYIPDNTFQSTRPVRGATTSAGSSPGVSSISIHAPRAGRDASDLEGQHYVLISIHAPRAGRDWGLTKTASCGWNFNPRAPCGARPAARHIASPPVIFQSTRPVRGATPQTMAGMSPAIFQSTRPVRGATAVTQEIASVTKISIHAPRAGRDDDGRRTQDKRRDFNPRAPCGARRPYRYKNQ